MKKILLTLVSLISINFAKGQTLIIEYDFENQIYKNSELKPKHKQPIVFKIINCNKIANSTQITSSDVKINDDFLDPKEEQVKKIIAEFKPVDEIKPTIELPVDINNYGKLQEINTKSFSDNPRISQLKNEIESKNKKIGNLSIKIKKNNDVIDKLNFSAGLNMTKLAEDLNNIIAPNTIEIIKDKHETITQTIQSKLTILENKNSDHLNEINVLKYERDMLQQELTDSSERSKKFFNLIDSLNKSYINFKSQLVEINRINAAYGNYIDFVVNPNLTKDQYINEANNICAILKPDKREFYYNQITEFDKKYSNFIEKYTALFADIFYMEINLEDPDYAKLVKAKFDIVKKDVEEIYSKVDITDLRKKMNNVEIIDGVLSTEKAFTIISDPVQPLEDYVEFKVKIKQSTTLSTSIIRENDRDFTYMEYVRQGVRWDVSVGTVFDFGIKNQEYEIQKTGDTTLSKQYKIIENNSNAYTPTLAGIMHTSFRTNNMFAFGFSLGVSIDVTELNFNSFFPGVSLLIGKREKMIFTIGPAFKRVQQIKSIYADNKYLAAEIQVADITAEKFKIGYFFGISYNLTNSQKSKIKNFK